MVLAQTALYKTTEMFLILLLGAALSKLGIIDAPSNKRLSNLLLMVVTPILVFTSYQTDITPELAYGWIQTFILSCISFALIIFFSRFLVPKSSIYDTVLERIAVIYPNSGYIGLPLLSVLFGGEGVFYMTVYITVFNVLIWIQGATLLNSGKSIKKTAKELVNNLKKPMVIASFLGVICFFLQLRLPALLEEPLESIATMNTPLAMLVAGISIAQTDVAKMLRNMRIYLISCIRLIVCPLLFILAVRWFIWDELPLITVFIASACPVGTSATLLALRYGRDDTYATQLLAVSTVFSILSIPAMLIVYGWMV